MIDGQAERHEESHRQAEPPEPAVDPIVAPRPQVESEQYQQGDGPQHGDPSLRLIRSGEGRQIATQRALSGKGGQKARRPARAIEEEKAPGVEGEYYRYNPKTALWINSL